MKESFPTGLCLDARGSVPSCPTAVSLRRICGLAGSAARPPRWDRKGELGKRSRFKKTPQKKENMRQLCKVNVSKTARSLAFSKKISHLFLEPVSHCRKFRQMHGCFSFSSDHKSQINHVVFNRKRRRIIFFDADET